MTEVRAWISILVLMMVALRQSYSAFRAAQIERREILRYSTQLAVTVLLLSFFPTAYMRAAVSQYQSLPVRELQAALQQVTSKSMAAAGQMPNVVEVSELQATGLLSEDTRRWLAGSSVALSASEGLRTPYDLARVSFPNGSQFRMSYGVRAPSSPLDQ